MNQRPEQIEPRFELRFRSLFKEGRGLSFPCDECGRVDMDSMTPSCKCNYLYARTVIGREYACPAVLPLSA